MAYNYTPAGTISGPWANYMAAQAARAPAPAAAAAPSTTPNTFNVNPPPQAGQGAYGAVPGPISIPPNLYQGVDSIYPNLGAATGNASNLIASQMRGEFTPDTEAALWNIANTYGVASGMPGAGLWSNKFMGNVAGAKEALQQQGLSNLNATTANLSHMVTDPNLAASIAARNATMAAAPNPADAVAAQLAQYYNALMLGQQRGYNPAGGTGTRAPMNFPAIPPGYTPPKPIGPGYIAPPQVPGYNTGPSVNTSNFYDGMPQWEYPELYDPANADIYNAGGGYGGGGDYGDLYNPDLGFQDYPELWDQSYDPNANADDWLYP